jgi:hypothetical protein
MLIGRVLFFARGNGDELFWKDKFHVAQWEGPSMHSRCLALFPFEVWEGGKDFFSFSLGSQYVPNMFPLSS